MNETEVFIDIENVLISLDTFMNQVKELGPIRKARAYHPYASDDLWQECRVIGVDVIRPPTWNNKPPTDMVMATDMIEAALTTDIQHIVLVSGDKDFLPALTLIRKIRPEITISVFVPTRGKGPSGRVTSLLSTVTPNVYEIDARPQEDVVDGLIRILIQGKPPEGYWTQLLLARWAMDARNHLNTKSEEQTISALRYMREQDMVSLERLPIPGSTEYRRHLILNTDHPYVMQVSESLRDQEAPAGIAK